MVTTNNTKATLLGGAGNDIIHAALGNETLGGGLGQNLFHLTVHNIAGATGAGTTDTINDFNTTDLLHVGNDTAIKYALPTYTVANGSGSFLLEDGTKVVLHGFTGTLNSTDFKH